MPYFGKLSGKGLPCSLPPETEARVSAEKMEGSRQKEVRKREREVPQQPASTRRAARQKVPHWAGAARPACGPQWGRGA